MPHHLTSGKSLNTGESENAAKGKASLHDFGNLGPQTFRPAEDLNTTLGQVGWSSKERTVVRPWPAVRTAVDLLSLVLSSLL